MSTIEDNSPERFHEAANDPAVPLAVALRDVGGEAVQTVSARDLHAFLEVGKDFSTWIKDRIEQYGFADGQDYLTHLLPNIGEKGQGRPTKEYAVTLDMAKELAMVERNEKGKQARQYFIECEKRARAAVPAFRLPQSFAEALRLAADQAEQIQQQQAVIEKQRPAVTFVENYVKAGNSLGIRKVVKLLGVKEREFIARLIGAKVLFRQGGDLMPYAEFTGEARGLFDVKTGNKNDHDWTQTRFTPKGVVWIAWKLYKRRVSESDAAAAADEDE